jgi:hypothetical protein
MKILTPTGPNNVHISSDNTFTIGPRDKYIAIQSNEHVDSFIKFEFNEGNVFIYHDRLKIEAANQGELIKQFCQYLTDNIVFPTQDGYLLLNHYCIVRPVENGSVTIELKENKTAGGDWEFFLDFFEKYNKLKAFW